MSTNPSDVMRRALSTTFNDASIDALVTGINALGQSVVSQHGKTTELSPAIVTYGPGIVPTRRGAGQTLGGVEASMILLGTWDSDALLRHCPGADIDLWRPFARYGPLVSTQLDRVRTKLKRDPSTRQAVIYLGRPSLLDEPPCVSLAQFVLRSGRLSVILHIRSWDLAYGLPYDVSCWQLVTAALARSMMVVPGQFSAIVGSLHVYEQTAHLAVSRHQPFTRVALATESAQTMGSARKAAREFLAGSAPPWWISQEV